MEEFTQVNSCVNCKSQLIKEHCCYKIKSKKVRKIYMCVDCKQYFSETKNTAIEGLHTKLSRIILILKSITEGMGVNAVCRVFQVGKNSIYRWQERLSKLKKTLLIYSLCHEFIKQIVEGDELYTKVKKMLMLASQQDGQ